MEAFTLYPNKHGVLPLGVVFLPVICEDEPVSPAGLPGDVRHALHTELQQLLPQLGTSGAKGKRQAAGSSAPSGGPSAKKGGVPPSLSAEALAKRAARQLAREAAQAARPLLRLACLPLGLESYHAYQDVHAAMQASGWLLSVEKHPPNVFVMNLSVALETVLAAFSNTHNSSGSHHHFGLDKLHAAGPTTH